MMALKVARSYKDSVIQIQNKRFLRKQETPKRKGYVRLRLILSVYRKYRLKITKSAFLQFFLHFWYANVELESRKHNNTSLNSHKDRGILWGCLINLNNEDQVCFLIVMC